jgi:hypothetical protein
MNFRQIEDRILEVFGPTYGPYALAISRAENRDRNCGARSPRNDNGTYDWGVFQLNDVHRERFRMYDFTNCEDNIQAAYILFKEEGWSPWVAYNNGLHRQYLASYQRYASARPQRTGPHGDFVVLASRSAAPPQKIRDFVVLMAPR